MNHDVRLEFRTTTSRYVWEEIWSDPNASSEKDRPWFALPPASFWMWCFSGVVVIIFFSFGACGSSSMRFAGRHTVNSVDGRQTTH